MDGLGGTLLVSAAKLVQTAAVNRTMARIVFSAFIWLFVAAIPQNAAIFLLDGGVLPGRRCDSFWFQLREQDHVADAFLAEQHHAQPVNTHAHAASGWHAVFERDEKIFVQFLLLAASLMLKPFALLDGIVLLGVGGRNFLAVDASLEDFDCRRARAWRAARVPWADA